MKVRKTISALAAAAMLLTCAPNAAVLAATDDSAQPEQTQAEQTQTVQPEAPEVQAAADPLPYQDESLSFEERAADLVARMTLEEKAAQTAAKSTPGISRLGVHSYYYWREGIHGVARQGGATSFPSSLAMSNTWDPELMQTAMDITSTEARGKNNKYDLNYWNPTINMARDPRWGRNEETYGEDPYLTAQIGGAAARGMEGTDEKYKKTMTTLKHYAANNCEGERQTGTSIMNERTMREYYSRAFRDIVKDVQPGAVMSSYNGTTLYRNGEILSSMDGQKIDYIASSANSYLLNDLLRRTYGFGGFVVGDCGAWDNAYGRAPLRQKLYPDTKLDDITAAMTVSKIVNAGSSLDCNSGGNGTSQVLTAVQQGLISEETLDVMVYELFLQRMKTGEFDSNVEYQKISPDLIECDEHVAKAEEAAEETWVLLENKNNALPLKNSVSNIAVVGGHANEVVLGDYSAEMDQMKSELVKPIDGITNEVKKINPNAEVNLIGNVSDTTPLFNIKGITLVKSDGKTTKLDLSTVTTALNLKKDGGELKDITKAAVAVIPGVDFGGVSEIQIEASSLPGMPNVTVAIGYNSASQNAANVQIRSTDGASDYKTNTGVYNGATGGYTEKADMYITVNASSEFSVENYKTSLDAADYIIAYGGTTTADSSESNDRASINLPASESHVQQICDAYPDKTIVVLQTVGQVNVEDFKDKCAAMLWTSYNGQKQGEALGKVLTGAVNPSGKLSTTWYPNADLSKMPIGSQKQKIDGVEYNFTNYELSSDINNKDADYPGRTYQYYNGTPVYPFGYGKSYTTFEFSNVKIDKASADANDTVTITADVKNTGSAAGDEVAQLYITVPGADGKTLPLKQLKGFERLTLNPGETKTATFSLDLSDVFFFDETKQQNYVIPGEYTAKVGGSSADAESHTVKFSVSGDIAETIDSVYAIPSGIKVYYTDGTAEVDASNPYTISSAEYADGKLSVSYSKKDGAPETATLFAAAYTDSSEQVMTSYDSVPIDGSGSQTLSVSKQNDGVIKAFIWDGTDNIKPLSNVYSDTVYVPANTLTAGANVTLKNDKVVTDFAANGISVKYSSSNTNVANVDESGNVTAGTVDGTATITVTASKADGSSASFSFPVVSQYREGIDPAKKAEYLARLDAAYADCPEVAYTPENRAELESIYTTFRAALEASLLDNGLELALNDTIAAMQAVPKIELADEYTVRSVNPNIISGGVINYNADGIGTVTATMTTIDGTISESNPAKFAMEAASGDSAVSGDLVWSIERLDGSSRKNAEINLTTGEVTLYTNGIYKITASDYTNKKRGSAIVYANLQIEGENADDGAGAKLNDVKDGASNNGLNAGNTAAKWLRFDGVKLDRLTAVKLRVSKESGDSNINVSLLPNSDWTIASATAQATGAWTNWIEVTADVNRCELAKKSLDENGCGSIYVQTNSANLDYISLEYNNDTIDPVALANGTIAVNTSLASGTITLAVGGEQKGTAEITAPGTYKFDGFKDGDEVNISIGGESKTITYNTPKPRDIYVYNFSDSAFDSFFDTAEGAKLSSGLGMDGDGGWQTDKGGSFKHNDRTYNFTRSLKGGKGQEGARRVWFTPDADGVVTAVFKANSERCMNIEQDGRVVTKYGDDTICGIQMNVKGGIPVYVYGGGSNKNLYAVLFEAGKTGQEPSGDSKPTEAPQATPQVFDPFDPADIITQYDVQFESFTKKWGEGAAETGGTGSVIGNTKDNDVYYFGEREFDNLAEISLNAAIRDDAGTATAEFFAVDVSSVNVDSATLSDINKLLTAENSLGKVTLVATKGSWKNFFDHPIRFSTSGKKGLFVKLNTTGKYCGNLDFMHFTYAKAKSASADAAALTAENDLAEISAQGSVVTSRVKSSGEVNSIDYNEEYGDDVTFEKLINWNGMVTALARENNADASKLLTSAMGSVWINATPDSYAEKDEGAPSSPVINDIAADGDQLYAGCDEGYMITMNPCSKCSTIKKVCDFDIKELGSDGETLYLSGDGENAEIAIADARQENIKADAAKELIAAGALPVDVRSAEEYAEDSIDGSVNVPVDEFGQWLATQDKNETIIVYCASGNRAGKAAEIAKEQGFKNIYNAGSINDLK